MRGQLEKLFDDAARARVEAAVRDAEERSDGEIVPVVVAASADYGYVRLRGALLGLAIATLIYLGAWAGIQGAAPIEWLLAAQIGGVFFGFILSLVPPVLRFLAGRATLERAIRERAVRAFFEHDLTATRHRTGVLVLASVLERRAVILGDAGIHQKMGDAEWQRAVDALLAGLRRGAAADGFCAAIAVVGAKLAEHFPAAAAKGENQLPNRLEIDDV